MGVREGTPRRAAHLGVASRMPRGLGVENAEIARVLGEIADLLELTGGNAFKARAYRRAAQVIDLHPTSLAELGRRWARRSPPARSVHGR